MPKRILCILLCFAIAVILPACGGNVLNVKRHDVASEEYNIIDINSAIDAVVCEFREKWNGCSLTDIYYVGDDKNSQYESFAKDNNADQVIVLISSFDVDSSGGDGSLRADSTYNNWNWILVRDYGGNWKNVDHGY